MKDKRKRGGARIFLAALLAILGVCFTNTIKAQAAQTDYFTGKIKNQTADGQEYDIDCLFKITKKAGTDGTGGEVEISSDYLPYHAIDKSTTGKIVIPEEVTHNQNNYRVTAVDNSAFNNCDKITNTGLENNNSVTSLGYRAYNNCLGLTSTGLENNSIVTAIGVEVFSNCSNLISTGLGNNNVLTRTGTSTFYKCTSLKETGLETNQSIQKIEDFAFSSCSGLEKVILPTYSKVNTIGYEAFSDCTNLSAFVITGETIPTINANAFLNTKEDFAIYYPVMAANGSITQVTAGKQYPGTNSATKDATVEITADVIEGKQFSHWSVDSNNVTLSDEKSPIATFTAIADVVKVSAHYVDIDYTVTVHNGEGSGKYHFNDTVTIKAKAAPAGKMFKGWSVAGDVISLNNPSDMETTFSMPAQDVEVTAVYEDINYNVTVNGGTGSGQYRLNDTVTIKAKAAPIGKQFKGWSVTGDAVSLNNPSDMETTFSMPAQNVEVTAVYEDVPKPVYDFIDGDNQIWTLGEKKNLTFTISGNMKMLTDIKINHKLLDSAYYIIQDNHIILKHEYLNTLSAGTYQITAVFEDGETTASFIIKKSEVTVKTPEVAEKTPEATAKTPEATAKKPEVTAKKPEVTVKDRTAAVQTGDRIYPELFAIACILSLVFIVFLVFKKTYKTN